MPLYDYKCSKCAHIEEDICPAGTKTIECEKCWETSARFFGSAPAYLTTIIPSYPGCKKVRAGYIHSHGDRPSTRVTGCGFSSSSD